MVESLYGTKLFVIKNSKRVTRFAYKIHLTIFYPSFIDLEITFTGKAWTFSTSSVEIFFTHKLELGILHKEASFMSNNIGF